jgi:hypothetical protein
MGLDNSYVDFAIAIAEFDYIIIPIILLFCIIFIINKNRNEKGGYNETKNKHINR